MGFLRGVSPYLEHHRFPDLLQCPNFSIEIACIQAEEVRRYDRRHGRRRRGWVIVERRLLGVLERHVIATPSDLWSLISWELPEPFQTIHLARVLNRPRWFAQKVAYCLRESGASTVIGKVGNALVYSRAPSDGVRLHISSGALSSILVPYPTECVTSTDARRTV
jgi:hypothetical protein